MTDLVYKEECFNIVRCCFDVFNELGSGLREKTYQQALEEVFGQRGINFKSQQYVPIVIGEKVVGRYFLDFLIDDRIALELKAGDHFHRRDIAQLLSYLKSKNLLLGLLVNFTSRGVDYKRIVNLK